MLRREFSSVAKPRVGTGYVRHAQHDGTRTTFTSQSGWVYGRDGEKLRYIFHHVENLRKQYGGPSRSRLANINWPYTPVANHRPSRPLFIRTYFDIFGDESRTTDEVKLFELLPARSKMRALLEKGQQYHRIMSHFDRIALINGHSLIYTILELGTAGRAPVFTLN